MLGAARLVGHDIGYADGGLGFDVYGARPTRAGAKAPTWRACRPR